MKNCRKTNSLWFALFMLLTLGSSTLCLAAKPTCPGHPSCDDQTGDVQLGSGDDIWPGVGDDNSGDDTVFGGAGADEIYGGTGNDHLDGQDGDDELYGEEGEDRLYGGGGFDRLFGGADKDRLYPDLSGEVNAAGIEQADFVDGGDSLNSNGLQHNDGIYLDFLDSVDVVMGEFGETGTYIGSYSITTKGKNGGTFTFDVEGEFINVRSVTSTEGNDTIVGTSGNDHLHGQDGDDILYGGDGDDQLDGGLWTFGDDRLYGGNGKDRMIAYDGDDYYEGGPGPDNILTREAHGHDTVAGFESGVDTLTIYNSDACWEDLVFSTVNADDNGVNDLRVEILTGKGNKVYDMSLTLLDVTEVFPDDFNFEHDNGNYSGCL